MKKISFKVLRHSVIAISLSSAIAGSAIAADESFNVTMTLQSSLVITETNALSFINTTVGTAATIITSPADALAATFSAQGLPAASVTGSIVENSIIMSTGGGSANEQIVVNSFSTGGDMNASGIATLDSGGQTANLRVGATANVLAANVPGNYAGAATFRLLY